MLNLSFECLSRSFLWGTHVVWGRMVAAVKRNCRRCQPDWNDEFIACLRSMTPTSIGKTRQCDETVIKNMFYSIVWRLSMWITAVLGIVVLINGKCWRKVRSFSNRRWFFFFRWFFCYFHLPDIWKTLLTAPRQSTHDADKMQVNVFSEMFHPKFA